MLILILDAYQERGYACGAPEESSFRPLGWLLTELPNLGKDVFVEWLEEPQDDCYSYYFFRLEKENRKIIVNRAYGEELLSEPLVIESSQFVQMVNKVYEYMGNFRSIVVMQKGNNYFVKGFSSYVMGFLPLKLNDKKFYSVYEFCRWHPLGGIGLLLVNEMKNKIFEWFFNTAVEAVFRSSIFIIEKKEGMVTITYKNEPFVTTTTIEEKYLLKINEYYENLIKQDIEDFLLIQTEEGYSFITHPFEEIKVAT